MNPQRHGQENLAIRFSLFQNSAIDFVLANRFLEVTHWRRAEKTLNFYGNFAPFFFRSYRSSLGAQIDEKIFVSVRNRQRIVRNGPTVPLKRLNDDRMINVLGRHRAHAASMADSD